MFIALSKSKLSLMNYLFEKSANSEYSEIESYFGLSFQLYLIVTDTLKG